MVETEEIQEIMTEIIEAMIEGDQTEIEEIQAIETGMTGKEGIAGTMVIATVIEMADIIEATQITEGAEMTDTEIAAPVREETLIVTEVAQAEIIEDQIVTVEVMMSAEVEMTVMVQETRAGQEQEGLGKAVIKETIFLKIEEGATIVEKAEEQDKTETETLIEAHHLLSLHGKKISQHSKRSLRSNLGKPKGKKADMRII